MHFPWSKPKEELPTVADPFGQYAEKSKFDDNKSLGSTVQDEATQFTLYTHEESPDGWKSE